MLKSVPRLTISTLERIKQEANEDAFEQEHDQKAQHREGDQRSILEMEHAFHHSHKNRDRKQAHDESSDHHGDEATRSNVWGFVAVVSGIQLRAAIITVR